MIHQFLTAKITQSDMTTFTPEAFVQKHGVERTRMPVSGRPDPDFHFLKNLKAARLYPSWFYCEGYAADLCMEVRRHSWLEDSEGRILDVNWPDAVSYVGCAFHLPEAVLNRGSFFGIFDFVFLRSVSDPWATLESWLAVAREEVGA